MPAYVGNQRQWGRHTGISTELPPYAPVFTLRESKLVRWRTFPNQESALEAVKQWLYKPTLLNGDPVEVITTIDVNFTLNQ